MYKIINILLVMLVAIIFGLIISDIAQIPGIAGIAALIIPAFTVNSAGLILFGVTLKSVARPTGQSPGAGGGINTYIIAILVEDILTMPERGDDMVTITGNIVMKEGKYMHTIYATDKKIKPVQTKEGTDDNPDIVAWNVGLEFWHPGLEKPILEFQAKHAHSNMMLIVRECASDKMYLLGEMCNTLHMTESELQWEATPSGGKGTQLGIKGQQSLPMAIYEGDLTLDPGETTSP